jgi:hypothetical protein
MWEAWMSICSIPGHRHHHRATTIRRSDVKRLALLITLAVLAIFIVIPAAFATGNTTNLNNIPITDTLEEGTFQWDTWARYNEDIPRGRRIQTRLFGALFDNFEFGMSWGIGQTAGPLAIALKYKILDEYDGNWPVSLAVGVEGITGNYQRTMMDPSYYGVIGIHDVRLGGWWDWYVGFVNNPTGYDDEDNEPFGGFKYWIDEDWQFNADYWGYDDYFRVTGGLNYDWVNHIGFAGWVEYDSGAGPLDASGDPEGDTYFVLELQVTADMRDLTGKVSDPE